MVVRASGASFTLDALVGGGARLDTDWITDADAA